MFTLLLLFCWLNADVYSESAHDYKVKTTEGVVIGAKAMDGDYIAFYGIPYAGSVSGKNRFKAAPEPALHNAKFKAVEMGIACAQPSSHGLVGKEDCLTLNIFTRNLTTSKPVIVWIDGEGFSNTEDTPRYSFKSLAHDTVVIALNYRLSIFGFLCLGVEEAPGNAGLKDVAQALKWIQKNVAGFGGDPNNVMLLGHGSGAAMVDLLTLSPLSEHLFTKAVALSGSALAPYAIAYDPAGYAKVLGSKLQYEDKTNAALAKLLTETDAHLLMNEINQFSFTNNSVLFAPCVENAKLNGSFLEDDPLKLIRLGRYNKPFIASFVNKEGTARIKEAVFGNWLKLMQDEFEAFLPANLVFKNESMRKNISQDVRRVYFGSTEDISAITPDNMQDYFAFEGDSLITIPVIRGVNERSNSGWRDLWLLEFSYKDQNHDWPYPNIRLDGVKHGGILDFIFDLDTHPVNETPKKYLVERLVAFAKTGKPDEEGTWPKYSVSETYYLSISGHAGGTTENLSPAFATGMQLKPHDQSMQFWESTLRQHFATPQPVSASGKLASSSVLVILCWLVL